MSDASETRFAVALQNSFSTQQTVNCLLSEPEGINGSRGLYFGTYQHDASTGERRGSVGRSTSQFVAASATDIVPSVIVPSGVDDDDDVLPGVFDMIHLGGTSSLENHERSTDGSNAAGGTSSSSLLLLSCTDGTLRAMRPSRKSPQSFAWVAQIDVEMLTSTAALSDGSFVCTAHLGGATHAKPDATGAVAPVQKWPAHEFDAWCACAFDGGDAGPYSVFTGGDDGRLCLWDLRARTAAPMLCARYDAGVTTVVDAHQDNRYVLVGSYDEHVHLVDVRCVKRPVASCMVGGGAWRIRPMRAARPLGIAGLEGQSSSSLALVAAMSGGAALVSLSRNEVTLLNTFHTTDPVVGDDNVLIYDVCWVRPNNDDNECAHWSADAPLTVATCSFYQKRVAIFSIRRT